MDLPQIPPNPDISAEQLRKVLAQAAKQEGGNAKQLLKLFTQAAQTSGATGGTVQGGQASAAAGGAATGATLGEIDIPPQLKANLLQVLSTLTDQSLLDELSRLDTNAAKRALTLGSSQDILKLEQALRQSLERQLSQHQPLKNLDSAIDTLKQKGANHPPSTQQITRVLQTLLETPANQLNRQIASLSVPLRQGVLDALLSRESRVLLPNSAGASLPPTGATSSTSTSASAPLPTSQPVTGLAQATRGVTTPQNLAAVTQSYTGGRSPSTSVSLSAALNHVSTPASTSPFQVASLAQALSQQGTSLASLSSSGQAGLLSVVTGQASQAPAQALLQQLPAQQLPLLLATPAALSASASQSQALVDQLVVRLLQPSSSLLSASTPLNASSLSSLNGFGSQASIAPIQSGALDQLVVQLQQADSVRNGGNGLNPTGLTSGEVPLLSDGLQQALRPALQVNTSAELTRLWELLHGAAQRLSQEGGIEARLRALLRYVSAHLPESARQALTEGLGERDAQVARLVQQIAQASSASQASSLAGATPRQGVDALLNQLLGTERHLLQQQTQLGGLRDAIHTLHGINDQALLLKAQSLLQVNPQFDAEFLLFYQGLVQRVAVQVDPDAQQGSQGNNTGQYMRFHFNFTRMGPVSANIHYREPSVTIVLRHQTPQAGATLDKHLDELKEKLNQFEVQVNLRVIHDPDMQLPNGPFHSVDTQA